MDLPSVGHDEGDDMGKNSQARRAARSRSRTRRHHDPEQHIREPSGNQHRAGPSEEVRSPRADSTTAADEAIGAWTALLNVAMRLGPTRITASRVATLTRLPADAVDQLGEVLVTHHVEALLQHGWQPAEVHRVARRHDAASGRLVGDLVRRNLARHLATHARDTVDPRWRAQVDLLGGPDEHVGSYVAWQRTEDLDRATAYAATLGLLVRLADLPPLRRLVPPPGAAPTGPGPTSASDPVLHKVRGLLAKAESTEFEAEAAALTAKAQELMTRHAIDQAALSAERPLAAPSTVRLAIETPYVEPKARLLQVVAEATRCRTVLLTGLDLSEVVGYPDDLAAVELLFTSLLLQAQRAMTEAGRRGGAGGRARSAAYRASFLRAYGQRIGERLAEANEHVMAGARADSSTHLPVLLSRAAAIDDHIAREYGVLSTSRARRGYDPAGAVSGRLAADQAELTSGHLPS